ncbi:metallophosphoesterase [Candidatus Micrarchaeota archaeon]|nr:metallophosphoesterase [Candidatus Micrarchaeota archaeon]MBU1930354.1 metallophosphoesterase [Candidatus Micrarchaeota archaeon]
MESVTQKKSEQEEIVELANQKNLFLSPEALQLLEKASIADAKKALQELADENVFIVNSNDIENKLIRTKITPIVEMEVSMPTSFKPLAKEYNANYRELKEYNLSASDTCDGSVQDFVKLFRDKLDFMQSILKNRQGFSPKPLDSLKESTQKREVNFIAIVQEKWVSKKGHLAFRLEDIEEECIALVLKDNAELMEQGNRILLDEVIGIKGTKGMGDLVIIKEILQPDLPLRSPKTVEVPLNACIISDIHAGSKLFLEKEFQQFLKWLNGEKGNPKEKTMVGKIKYLFICGDNVDGIGIYPDQAKNLAVKDIFEQYQVLEKLLLNIPEYIETFIIPGQHDSVRWADPQPPIPKEYAPQLHKQSNIHFLPSPGWVEIEGLKTLMYHGAAIHELYGTLGNLSMSEPQKAIIEILKRRTFLLNYGSKQPYAPEQKDFLSIREAPDLYFGGDMHHFGSDTYRGCTIINGGCFQSQTEYEIKQGHVPTPGIAAILGLENRKITLKNFLEEQP